MEEQAEGVVLLDARAVEVALLLQSRHVADHHVGRLEADPADAEHRLAEERRHERRRVGVHGGAAGLGEPGLALLGGVVDDAHPLQRVRHVGAELGVEEGDRVADPDPLLAHRHRHDRGQAARRQLVQLEQVAAQRPAADREEDVVEAAVGGLGDPLDAVHVVGLGREPARLADADVEDRARRPPGHGAQLVTRPGRALAVRRHEAAGDRGGRPDETEAPVVGLLDLPWSSAGARTGRRRGCRPPRAAASRGPRGRRRRCGWPGGSPPTPSIWEWWTFMYIDHCRSSTPSMTWHSHSG